MLNVAQPRTATRLQVALWHIRRPQIDDVVRSLLPMYTLRLGKRTDEEFLPDMQRHLCEMLSYCAEARVLGLGVWKLQEMFRHPGARMPGSLVSESPKGL